MAGASFAGASSEAGASFAGASSEAGASFAGADNAAGSAGSSGEAGAGSAGADNYVPTGATVPSTGDGRLKSGGSFEHGQGANPDGSDSDSYDNCGTNHARGVLEKGDAANGTAFMRLQSQLAPGHEVHPSNVDSQFGFWFQTPLPANEPLYLYFAIINLSARAPIGDITIARANGICQTAEPLATIPLERLALSNQWQTRCVELHPTDVVPVLGWWAAGTDFVIGVDEFRFGPPCQH